MNEAGQAAGGLSDRQARDGARRGAGLLAEPLDPDDEHEVIGRIDQERDQPSSRSPKCSMRPAGLALDVVLGRSQAPAVGEELVAGAAAKTLLGAPPARPALIWRS